MHDKVYSYTLRGQNENILLTDPHKWLTSKNIAGKSWKQKDCWKKIYMRQNYSSNIK